MRIFVYMTTVIEFPDAELETVSALLQKIGGNFIDDGGFTASELESIKQALKEVKSIKSGESSPLSMSDLWDD